MGTDIDWDTQREYPYRKPATGTFLVVQGGEPIGETTITRSTSAMAKVGIFKPYPAYERLRPFFQMYFENVACANERYAERDALGMTLTTRDGRRIPVDWIELYDTSLKRSDEEALQVSFPVPEGFFDDPSLWVDDES